MALTNPPGWLQNAGATHTAAQMRSYLSSLQAGNFSTASGLKARGGVHPTLGNELAVSQTGSPSMAVLVETGVASIPGSESATQGNYFALNDAQVTLSVTTAHATLPRIDIVVINIRDQQYSGSSNDSQLQVIAGTPASSPVAPSAPNNSLTLAQVAVGAAVTSIVNANITDTRQYLAAAGGVINARTDATRPASAEIAQGQLVWGMDTKHLYLWDGTVYNQVFPDGYTKISQSTLGSSQASVTFSSIPSTYTTLHLMIQARSDTAATVTNLLLRFNGDTGSNYDAQSLYGQTSSTGAAESLAATASTIPEISAASATANHAGTLNLFVPNYTGTAFLKIVDGTSISSFGTSAGQFVTRKVSGRWRSTAAITSITVLPAAGNFITGSFFALYGIL